MIPALGSIAIQRVLFKVYGSIAAQSDYIPDSKDHGANMGPTWVLSAPDGPHLGPMNLAIRNGIIELRQFWIRYGSLPVNTLRQRQNGRFFPDEIFKWIFLNEYICIYLRISLKFVPRVQINNIPALVQIMAWRCPGASHYLNQWWYSLLTHICITRPQWVKSKIS